MIDDQRYEASLKALGRLIIQAKSEAYEAGAVTVAELLNDIELLPEYLADDADRTDELVESLEGVAVTHPRCRYIVEEFFESPAHSS